MSAMLFLKLYALSHDCNHLEIGVQKQKPPTDEEDSREFQFVYLIPEPQKVVKSPELFMLVKNNCRVNCVTIFECIFDESKSLFDVNSQLVWSG
jgi:hypothetical protein